MTEYDLLKIDFLIAEKVLGWNRLIVDDGFHPSVDMEASMAIVLKFMREQNLIFQLDNIGKEPKRWRCHFDDDESVSPRSEWPWTEAETPSLAICYAALKLKGIEILGG